jgi:hypothetical protein
MPRHHSHAGTMTCCGDCFTPQCGLSGNHKVSERLLEQGEGFLILSPPYKWPSDLWPQISTILQISRGLPCSLAKLLMPW